jgi:hypothetical protein
MDEDIEDGAADEASSAIAEKRGVGISVTLSSIWTVRGGRLPALAGPFRSDDFFRNRGSSLSSLFLRELVGVESSTPIGLTAHRDPSSSSSGKSNAGASSNEIFELSLNRSVSGAADSFDSRFSCADSNLVALDLRPEYGLRDVCHSVGGESAAACFPRFVLTVIPSLAPGVPGEGARLGSTVIGSRFTLLAGVMIEGVRD